MIRLENVTLSFEGKEVLKNFSAEIKDRGIYLITGPSGSGKTSLIRLILGLSKQDSGTITCEGAEFSAVFQEDRLIPTLSAISNVALVSDRQTARRRLAEVGLSSAEHLYPEELSGGMKRRVAIARALAFSKNALILDEAFTGIEDSLARKILKNVAEEYRDKLIIAVTHRPELFSDYEVTEIKL